MKMILRAAALMLVCLPLAQAEEKNTGILHWPANPPAHWTRYHLAHPEPNLGFYPGDPTPAFQHMGHYHLHYLYRDTGGVSEGR